MANNVGVIYPRYPLRPANAVPGHLVVWGARGATFADGGVVPTGSSGSSLVDVAPENLAGGELFSVNVGWGVPFVILAVVPSGSTSTEIFAEGSIPFAMAVLRTDAQVSGVISGSATVKVTMDSAGTGDSVAEFEFLDEGSSMSLGVTTITDDPMENKGLYVHTDSSELDVVVLLTCIQSGEFET